MSTRSHIGIYDAAPPVDPTTTCKTPDCLLYRHSDGYPTGMLPELVPAVQAMKGRWTDTEYFAARVLHHLMVQYDTHTSIWDEQRKTDTPPLFTKQQVYEDMLKKMPETGYGISYDKVPHSDIEYYYAVYNNGIIHCYAAHGDEFGTFKYMGQVDVEGLDKAGIEKLAKELESK